MHIFIDESGIFAQGQKADAISAVGALIVPEARLARLEEKYAALRPDLLKDDKSEVKGRLLNEAEIAKVVSLLLRYEVLFEVTAIDLALHKSDEIVSHQMAQAERITKNLTDKHSQKVQDHVRALRRRLEQMAPQLYAQAVTTFSTIRMVLQHATMFYAQRIPKELGAFYWVVDAKDRTGITDWEAWWSVVVSMDLQFRSISEPFATLEGADYSHFERFHGKLSPYMQAHFMDEEEGVDGGLLLSEHLKFSSETEPCLEIVDILTNAVRRAMLGRLGKEGWHEIRGLMIHRKEPYIQLISLRDAVVPPSFESVVRHFSEAGKSMLSPRFLREAERRPT